MLQAILRKAISLHIVKITVLAWRTKAPKAAGEPYGEAPFRTFTRHSFPLFSRGSSSKRSPVPERDNFVQIGPFMPIFARSGMLHAFSPCIYQAGWSDAAFGAASQSWKDICQSEKACEGLWLFWSARWPLWGGPSLSAGLRRKASLLQRAVS